MMLVVTLIVVGTLVMLFVATTRSIKNEHSPRRSVWREFGLGLVLIILFLAAWIGQAISEWQTFTDEQRAQGDVPLIGDFMSRFGAATLENWQSEFLQLFSFVTLTALYIHKGSGESKDGSEKIEASLRRIESQLGTLPDSAPRETAERWKLPDTPLELQDVRHGRNGHNGHRTATIPTNKETS